MLSKKTLIIKAFTEMNISLLEVLLDDNSTYQKASKETFLEKMNVVFEQFKQSDDTSLLPISGICNGKSCNNKGCSGFSFIGNHSNSHIDLVFDETKDDFKDIYKCSTFKIKNKGIKKKDKLNFDIGLDEQARYSPSPTKAKAFQDCKTACNEIVKSQNQIFTKEFLLYWLEKNSKLLDYLEDESNEFFVFVYNSIDEFRNLFYSIERRIKYIEFDIPASNALADYQRLDVSDETILLKWLVENEELYDNVAKITSSIDNDGRLKLNYSKLLVEQKVIDGNYKSMTLFEIVYEEHYWSMLDKYQVLDNEVPEEMSTDSEEYKKYCSLKHNLQKRGIQV